MRWIEALRQNPALWEEFKAYLEEVQRRETDKCLDIHHNEWETQRQIGKALSIRQLLHEVTATERKEYAESARRERQSG